MGSAEKSNEVSAVPLGLEEDAVGARIVREELRLFDTVVLNLERARKEAASRAGGTEDDARLLELREDVAVAKPEDLPALFEQMHTLGALRAHRGKSVVGSIDEKSPYFGHLRLEELFPGDKTPRRRDVLVGAKSYVDPNAGIRIVDWRNAPVSRVFYRYREGDEYEEILGRSSGRRHGARASLRRDRRRQIAARRVSKGVFICDDKGAWRRTDAKS